MCNSPFSYAYAGFRHFRSLHLLLIFSAFAIKVHRKNTGKYRKVQPAELLRLGHMVIQIVDDIPEQLLFHRFIVDLVAGTVVQGNGNVL